MLHLADRLILFECKLTRHGSAESQLLQLYGPVLARYFPALPQVHVSVFHNPGRSYELHPDSPNTLLEVLNLPLATFVEWHWLGA